MSNRMLTLDDGLYQYILSVSLREPEVLVRRGQEKLLEPMSCMLTTPEKGHFMALLAQLVCNSQVGLFE